MTSVFLVDDHAIVREGLASILNRQDDIEVIGNAPSAESALQSLPDADPDVVVLDHRLPGMTGADLCREIAERRIRARVVMLSAFIEEDVVETALMSGARAFVVKDIDPTTLLQAIRVVASGATLIDPTIDASGRWATAVREGEGASEELTGAQLTILRYLMDGHSVAEIARRTVLSAQTVRRYLRLIYSKLGAHNRAEACSAGLRRGLY